MDWHSLPINEAIRATNGHPDGLDDDSVRKKREEFGPNELTAKKRKSPLTIFLHQFADVMIVVLAAAAVISGFLGEVSDTIVIIVIIILNAIVGFVQEYRAEKAMEALQKMTVPKAKLIRKGQPSEIPSSEIVPGDIVLLEAGNMVPADMRLLEVHSLKADEASLTGESNAVDKTTEPIAEKNLSPGDKTNLAFKGTVITNGRAKGLVFATGMNTELGKIAGMLQEKESETPLQRRMKEFSRKLTIIILVICALMFTVGYLRGEDVTTMLLTAISVAVAAIPEALPAVITISLALGAKKLVSQNVLIRKLHAVETLGSVSYICSDKTGTLTKNQMTVKEIWTPDEKLVPELIKAMSLNHDVSKAADDKKATGDPTEIAMVKYAQEHQEFSSSWISLHSREEELPFDSDRKAMSTIHKDGEEFLVLTKGASESLANVVTGDKQSWRDREEEMAGKGMRIIAFAKKKIKTLPDEVSPKTIESDLDFIGLAGLIDPPREEAKKAISECKQAGIIPVMITGDHPLTAAAIARELGILDSANQRVMTGKELASLNEEAYKNEVENIRVYARVSPEQKLNIVKALQEKDHYVAMTGDGVNDAPSLRRANIGVAMGITGTDVTREAAHMILLDDNFATIIKAVRQGRRIYDNIRKFVKYILTGNTAEIWTIFLAPLLGLPIPLLPVHILWVNLVTDGLPALALASEPAEKSLMNRKPRKAGESIFAGGLGLHVLWVGILIGFICIATQSYMIKKDVEHWQTIVFSILCFCQLWHVMAIRSDTRSLFKQGLLSNKVLLGAVVLTIILQLAIIYVPAMNTFFHTTPLTINELIMVFAISSITFIAVEIEKVIKRRKLK